MTAKKLKNIVNLKVDDGKNGMPVVNLDPRDECFFNNPYAAYQFLHQETPTFFWKDYGHWCCAGFNDVDRLLRDKRLGRQILHVATREELGMPSPQLHTSDFDRIDGLSMLQLEPPAHTRLRRLVSRAFISTQIERLQPFLESLTHSLIDNFESSETVDLLKEFAEPIPVIVIAQMLGVPREKVNQLLEWSHRMVAMYAFGRNRTVEDTANLAAREFRDYIVELIKEKRSSPCDDLLSHMCSAQEGDDSLSEDELVSTTILLLNAGHEATVHQTGNAIKAILESCATKRLDSPDVYFSSAAETACTVEEAMRFDPPLHMFNRYALEDISLKCSDREIHLKKGDEIGLMLGAANHDPNVFNRPDEFNPHRSNLTHLSFGGGIHFCLGAPLARLEMQTSLKILFERLPKMRLACKPTYRDAYHFHGLSQLVVEPGKS